MRAKYLIYLFGDEFSELNNKELLAVLYDYNESINEDFLKF